jgi:uncharacterized HAD superfamily protein/orotate phosphoribosyltransferase-like protein
MPCTSQKAWNLASSIGDFISDGFKLASTDEYERRLKICDGCDARTGNKCVVCGCNLSGKARGRAFNCPVGKWNTNSAHWKAPLSTDELVKWSRLYAEGDMNPEYALASRLRYVTAAQLARDSVRLAEKLPCSLSGIAGIPRSGMIPASIIASLLHLPLYEVSKKSGFRQVGNGIRGTNDFGDKPDGPLLIVDDTIYSGFAIASARNSLVDRNALTAVVYSRPAQASLVDYHAEILPSPHLLEWNIFNSGMTNGSIINPSFRGGIATDLDGVLCEECPVDCDGNDTPEQDEKYRQWIINAGRLRSASLFPIPLIVSFRLEKFRAETEDWLRRNRIMFDKLVMHPAQTFAERNANWNVASHKGTEYMNSACNLFVESSDLEAQEIFAHTKRPVLSIEKEIIYQ